MNITDESLEHFNLSEEQIIETYNQLEYVSYYESMSLTSGITIYSLI